MNDEVTIGILKALADKTRIDIVRSLVREEDGAPCSKVSNCSSLSQPAMSHHFHKLIEAGVITEQKEGKEKFYVLNKEILAARGIDPARL